MNAFRRWMEEIATMQAATFGRDFMKPVQARSQSGNGFWSYLRMTDA